MIEFTTPVGRLVTGHPMVAQPKKDKQGAPKLGKDNQPLVQFYSGFAIPKTGETDWKQTEWGVKLYNEAASAFPNGEYQRPNFAWKIIDGDSTVPNNKGKIPNQREGWPNHWILSISNGFPFSCYHDGKFNPFESIKNKDEIKTGDYCQFILQVTGNNINGAVDTDGMYVNPASFNLVRAGIKIVSANEVDAATGFGGSNRALPQGAMVDPNMPQGQVQQGQVQQGQVQQGQVQQATEFLAPATGGGTLVPRPGTTPPAPPSADFSVLVDGVNFTASALKSSGWTDDQIAACPRV